MVDKFSVFTLLHLAFAAWRAIFARAVLLNAFARALPPLLAPNLPSATAAALRVSGVTDASDGGSVAWMTCRSTREAAD
jgi:hypothetical protein